jgi:hypothetical protein
VAPRARTRRAELAFLAAGTAAVALLHLALFRHVPPGVAKDVAAEAIRGYRLVAGRHLEVLTFSVGPSAETLWLYVVGALSVASGPSWLAIALPSMLAAMAVVLFTALLAKRIAPALPVEIPFLLSAGSVWLLHFGQAGLRTIASPLFVVVAALLALRAEETGAPRRYLVLGAVMALSLYAYTSCRLLPLAWGLSQVVRWIRRREERRAVLRAVEYTFFAFLVVSIPNIRVAARLPDDFFTRGYYTVRGGAKELLTNLGATLLLPLHTFDAYRTSFGEGHAFDEIGVALTEAGLPVVDLATGLLVVSFFVLARGEARRRAGTLLWIHALAVLLLGATGPSPTRLLLLQPVFVVLAAVAAGELVRMTRAPRALTAAVLVVWAAFQVGRYVLVFGRSDSARDHFRAAETAMAERARDLEDAGKSVLLVVDGGAHVTRYFSLRHLDRLWLDKRVGWDRPALEAFDPDVVLVEKRAEPLAEAAPLGPPARSETLYVEFTPARRHADRPHARGNVMRAWSDIGR